MGTLICNSGIRKIEILLLLPFETLLFILDVSSVPDVILKLMKKTALLIIINFFCLFTRKTKEDNSML